MGGCSAVVSLVTSTLVSLSLCFFLPLGPPPSHDMRLSAWLCHWPFFLCIISLADATP